MARNCKVLVIPTVGRSHADLTVSDGNIDHWILRATEPLVLNKITLGITTVCGYSK